MFGLKIKKTRHKNDYAIKYPRASSSFSLIANKLGKTRSGFRLPFARLAHHNGRHLGVEKKGRFCDSVELWSKSGVNLGAPSARRPLAVTADNNGPVLVTDWLRSQVVFGYVDVELGY